MRLFIAFGLMTILSLAASLPQLSSRHQFSHSNETEDVEDIAEHTLTLIAKGQTEIPLEDEYKDVVLLIGNSGAGKTTLAKFLTGVELESYETEGGFLIRDTEGKIQANLTSARKPVYPALLVDNATKTAYYDLPTFSDTGNASIEIANGMFMKIVADHVEKIKIVFVVPYISLQNQENHENFRTLFDHATDFIKKPEKFQKAIALVVTKVDPKVEDETVLKEIVSFLKSEKQSVERAFEDETKRAQVSEILDAFLTQNANGSYHRIGVFKKPAEAGPLQKIEYFQKLLPQLKEIIEEHIEYVPDEPEDFGMTISKRVHKYINAIAEQVREGFRNGLRGLANSIGNHYELLITTHPLEAVVGTVAKDTMALDAMLKSLENSASRQEYIEMLFQGLVQVSVPSNNFLAGILFQQSNLEFIEIIEGNETKPLISEWTRPLNETVGFLKEEMEKMLQMLNSRMDKEIQRSITEMESLYNLGTSTEANGNSLGADLFILEGMLKNLTEKSSFNELLHFISNSINNLSINTSFSTDTLELEEDIEIPSYPQLEKKEWLGKFESLVQKLKEEATTENVLAEFDTTMPTEAFMEDNELHYSEAERNEVRDVRDQIANLTAQISAMAEDIKTTEHHKKELEHQITEYNKSLQELHKIKANLRQKLLALKHKLEGVSSIGSHDLVESAEAMPKITTDYGVCASVCKNFTYSYNWCYLKKFRYNDYYWDYCTPPANVDYSHVPLSTHGLPCKSECKLDVDVYKCTTERFGVGSKFEKSDYCSPQPGYDYKNRKCKGNCFEASATKVCFLETGQRSKCSF